MKTIELIKQVGQIVFYNPQEILQYDTLAKKSLAPNTYRGFHKIDKSRSGAKVAFEKILLGKFKLIRDGLLVAKSEKDLDQLEREICSLLKDELLKNIINHQLNSFNKIRKPVDIFIEHLIAMGADFSEQRLILTKHLFLPLDSQMFLSNIVFSDQEMAELKIKRSFTFKDIRDEYHYYEIQTFLKEKAAKVGIENRIFFDLIWNNRYKSNGGNLFATNPVTTGYTQARL